MRKLNNGREMIGAKVVYGSFLMQIEQCFRTYLCCPRKKGYWEYSAGIGNIFCFSPDFT
jgi:hypothetical protein